MVSSHVVEWVPGIMTNVLLVSFNWIHNVYACLWIMRKFCWLCEYSKSSASSHRTDYFPTGENFCRVKLSRSRPSFTHTHLFSHTTLCIYDRLVSVRWFAQFYNNEVFSRCRMKWPICFFQFVSFRFHTYPHTWVGLLVGWYRNTSTWVTVVVDDDDEEVVFGARAPLLDLKLKSHKTFTRTGTHLLGSHTTKHVSKSTLTVFVFCAQLPIHVQQGSTSHWGCVWNFCVALVFHVFECDVLLYLLRCHSCVHHSQRYVTLHAMVTMTSNCWCSGASHHIKFNIIKSTCCLCCGRTR